MKHTAQIQKEFATHSLVLEKQAAFIVNDDNIPSVGESITRIVYNDSDQGGPMLTLYFGDKNVPVHCEELPESLRKKLGIVDFVPTHKTSCNSLPKILLEKQAADWDSFSYEAQKEYLREHPKSKKRMTAELSSRENDNLDATKDKDTSTKMPSSLWNVQDTEKHFSGNNKWALGQLWAGKFHGEPILVQGNNGNWYEAEMIRATRSRGHYIKIKVVKVDKDGKPKSQARSIS
jgi:hypothetical protein